MNSSISSNRAAKIGAVFTILGLIGVVALMVLAIEAPLERTQKLAQKIVYIHAPAAWASLVAFLIAGVASVGYLIFKDDRLDSLAESSVEVGLVFGVLLLATGTLYARTAWGPWWAPEARLRLTLILVLVFVGYRILRRVILDREERARFSAVIGVMALFLVPLVHIAVYLFPTLHPKPVLVRPDKPDMPTSMLVVFLVGIAAFTLLYFGFITLRYQLSRHRLTLEAQ